MPYALRKNGNKTCVINTDTGENKGCSDSHKMAVAHMRALYAHETKGGNKEVNELVLAALNEYVKEYGPDEEIEMLTKDMGMTADGPSSFIGGISLYGATTFAELDALRNAQEAEMEATELAGDFTLLAQNILYNPGIEDKGKALSDLADEFQSRVKSEAAGAASDETKEVEKSSWIKTITSAVVDELKNLFIPHKEKENSEDVMLWKETDGRYHWFARYSNKFRDVDNPPEIIADQAHRLFVERVDKGLAPLPDLWIWHVPEWKIGQANWLAYDDAGFAVASGTIDKGKEEIAEWLMTLKEARVSHGMPPSTIRRDEQDPTVITAYETREISVLPYWAAANKLTGFSIADNTEEADMAIPAEKKEQLISKWGINPALIESIEKANQADAQKAAAEGIESKEAAVVETVAVDPATAMEAASITDVSAAVEETETETEKTEQVAAQEVDAADQPPTRREVADAVASVILPITEQMQALSEQFAALSKEITALRQSDEDKVEKAVTGLPAASVAALLAQRVIKGQETIVDGRSSLAKSKPKEAEAPEPTSITGVPFVDRMLSTPSK